MAPLMLLDFDTDQRDTDNAQKDSDSIDQADFFSQQPNAKPDKNEIDKNSCDQVSNTQIPAAPVH